MVYSVFSSVITPQCNFSIEPGDIIMPGKVLCIGAVGPLLRLGNQCKTLSLMGVNRSSRACRAPRCRWIEIECRNGLARHNCGMHRDRPTLPALMQLLLFQCTAPLHHSTPDALRNRLATQNASFYQSFIGILILWICK